MKIASFQSLAVLSGCVLVGAAATAADVQATDFADANTKISVYTARDCTHLARTVPGAFMRRANGHDGISLDSCSGEVYMQVTTSPELSACAAVEADGFYYSYIPCSKDLATAGGASATTTTAVPERALQADTPAPTAYNHSEVEGHTPSPTEHVHSMHEGHTPSPAGGDAPDAEEADAEITDGAAGSGGGVASVGKALVSCAVALGAAGVVWAL